MQAESAHHHIAYHVVDRATGKTIAAIHLPKHLTGSAAENLYWLRTSVDLHLYYCSCDFYNGGPAR